MPDPSVRVWDLPVRLTHWSFAFLVPAMWWTAENSEWALHKRFGVTLLGLLVFRILWGFLGTRTARFASFVKGGNRENKSRRLARKTERVRKVEKFTGRPFE